MAENDAPDLANSRFGKGKAAIPIAQHRRLQANELEQRTKFYLATTTTTAMSNNTNSNLVVAAAAARFYLASQFHLTVCLAFPFFRPHIEEGPIWLGLIGGRSYKRQPMSSRRAAAAHCAAAR